MTEYLFGTYDITMPTNQHNGLTLRTSFAMQKSEDKRIIINICCLLIFARFFLQRRRTLLLITNFCCTITNFRGIWKHPLIIEHTHISALITWQSRIGKVSLKLRQNIQTSQDIYKYFVKSNLNLTNISISLGG